MPVFQDPNPGGFGSATNPDLSNAWKQARYEQFKKGEGEFAGGGGGGGLDVSSVPSALEFAKSLGVGEEESLSRLVMAMRAQEKPLDIYGRLETEAGLPELRTTSQSLSKEIAGIEDYLDRIEPNVSARTRESLVTEAQRQRMVGAEKLPFLQNLSKLATGLGRVRESISETAQGIGTKTQLAMAGQEKELDAYKLNYQALVDRNARLMTGFTADRQSQLDVLFAKWNRQNQLEDQEWELGNQIAAEERDYSRTLQTTAAGAGVKLTGGESPIDILGLIGTAAAEQIQFERRKTGQGTESERTKAAATLQLRRDAMAGGTFEDMVRRYSDTLPLSTIRSTYNESSIYGTAKESEAKAQEFAAGVLTPYQREQVKKSVTGDLILDPNTGKITIKK